MNLARSVDLSRVIERGLRTVYQPIVELESGAIIGFEALTRGPAGSPLEMPDDLFGAARAESMAGQLDARCLESAVRGASGMPRGALLFVNVEPATLTSDLIRRTAPISAAGDVPIMLEITERALSGRPEELLAGVQTAREHGWRIALDDVGVDPTSLAFLPIMRPDVVKLDMGLIRGKPDRELGRTMTAVMAYAERSGAVVLAEGIEDDRNLERAISLGATWGQGWRFGHPGPMPSGSSMTLSRHALPPAHDPRKVALSPFDAVTALQPHTRVAAKSVLLQISHHLESQALNDPGSTLMLSAFQDVRHFTPDATRRYTELGRGSALCAAFGIGLPPEPAPGVRGATLFAGDPLTDEWSVVVLSPYYTGALLGRDLGEIGADPDRRFRYVVTHDRNLVELAAESLLRRVTADW